MDQRRRDTRDSTISAWLERYGLSEHARVYYEPEAKDQADVEHIALATSGGIVLGRYGTNADGDTGFEAGFTPWSEVRGLALVKAWFPNARYEDETVTVRLTNPAFSSTAHGGGVQQLADFFKAVNRQSPLWARATED